MRLSRPWPHSVAAVDVRLVSSAPSPEALEEAREVYASAFGEPPYDEPPEMARAFVERVERYARDRDGFRLVTARSDDGVMVAVALAVLARPGDFWRDKVARVLPDEVVTEWLGDVCLEVVHLAVTPGRQGEGIGRLVHDVLIAGRPAPTGLLSVHPAATPAQRLYLGRSWTVLTEELPTDGPDYWLMGRRL